MDDIRTLGESLPRPGPSTPSCRPHGHAELPLREEPDRQWLPAKARRRQEVDPGLIRSLALCCRGEAPWPLTVVGPPGVGKTCAALLALDHAGGYYFTAEGLTDLAVAAGRGQLTWRDLHESLGDHGGTLSAVGLWRVLAKATLVVLDDLGTRGRAPDPQYGAVKQLLDHRDGRPLVALSNLDLKHLADAYDYRVASRLAAGTVLALEGDDRRLLR